MQFFVIKQNVIAIVQLSRDALVNLILMQPVVHFQFQYQHIDLKNYGGELANRSLGLRKSKSVTTGLGIAL